MLPHHRQPVRAGWAGWAIVAVLLILVPTACQIGQARAEPRFVAQGADVTVVIHDEPCAFKDQVTNLPLRATWREKDKTIEGCWNLNEAGVVMFWFEDRTVVGLPKTAFAKLGKT